jgi:hypothetical protein
MKTAYRTVGLAAILLLLLLFAAPVPGTSYYTINPPSQPGFPVTLRQGRPIEDASVTLADLDGNAKTLEIIAAGADKNDPCRGRVYAIRPDGTVYWETQVRAPVGSSPAVADVDGDGVPEVVIGLGGVFGTQCWHGGVVALNGRTGQVKWTFDTQDWLNHAPDGWRDGVYSTPAIGDITGDGNLEIVFGSWDQCIYLLDGHGRPLWPELNGITHQTHCGGHGFYNEDTIWSSAALADLDGNGMLEIIIGADISPGNRYGLPAGGLLYVLRYDGAQLARRWVDQAIYSSPSVADLTGDGKLEVVVGTGNYLKDRGFYVKVFNYEPGVTSVTERLVQKWHLPTSGHVFASPSIGDLNGDGYQDISILSYVGNAPWHLPNTFNGMRVFAWSGRSGTKLFETPVCDSWNKSGISASSTVVGDVGRAGEQNVKVLFGHIGEVGVLTGQGTYYSDPGATWTGNCKGFASVTDLTYWTDWLVYTTPALGDIDGDGKVEVVIAGSSYNDEYAKIYAWEPGTSVGAVPWPMFRQNRFNTGNATIPVLTASATSISIPYTGAGMLATPVLRVTNGRPGSILAWTATVAWSGSVKDNWFTLSRVSGETATFDTLTLNLNEGQLQAAGTYRAQITLKGVTGTENSPLVVNVSYVVPGPTLGVDPEVLLVFMDTEGPATQTRQVQVSNMGAGGAIAWRASADANWLSVAPSTGSTDTSPALAVTVNRSGLADGHYQGTVRITATTSGVVNPEQTVTVHAMVGPVRRVFLPSVLRAAR